MGVGVGVEGVEWGLKNSEKEVTRRKWLHLAQGV